MESCVFGDAVGEAGDDAGDVGAVPKAVLRVVVPEGGEARQRAETAEAAGAVRRRVPKLVVIRPYPLRADTRFCWLSASRLFNSFAKPVPCLPRT